MAKTRNVRRKSTLSDLHVCMRVGFWRIVSEPYFLRNCSSWASKPWLAFLQRNGTIISCLLGPWTLPVDDRRSTICPTSKTAAPVSHKSMCFCRGAAPCFHTNELHTRNTQTQNNGSTAKLLACCRVVGSIVRAVVRLNEKISGKVGQNGGYTITSSRCGSLTSA